METNNLSTSERTKIKTIALCKLDQLIEAELKRLYAISSIKPSWENFEIRTDGDRFSLEELEEVKNNITNLNKLSSVHDEEREKAINYLKITLQSRAIECPWDIK